MNDLDWCPCYLEMWRGEGVRMMSLAAQGAYWALLMHQFREGSIPDDPAMLARLLCACPSDFAAAWQEISPKFESRPGGRLVNLRMEQIRKEQLEKRDKCRAQASRAAGARWGDKARPKDAAANVTAVDRALLDGVTSVSSDAPGHADAYAGAMPGEERREEDKQTHAGGRGARVVGCEEADDPARPAARQADPGGADRFKADPGGADPIKADAIQPDPGRASSEAVPRYPSEVGAVWEVMLPAGGEPEMAAAFLDYYQAVGWTTTGLLPITDWKACARLWVRSELLKRNVGILGSVSSVRGAPGGGRGSGCRGSGPGRAAVFSMAEQKSAAMALLGRQT